MSHPILRDVEDIRSHNPTKLLLLGPKTLCIGEIT